MRSITSMIETVFPFTPITFERQEICIIYSIVSRLREWERRRKKGVSAVCTFLMTGGDITMIS